MKVVCISGKANHGKDSVANLLRDELRNKGFNVLIAHYADLLKYLCQTYFGWNGEKDEAGRELLQSIGGDIIRNIDEDYFVHFLGDFLSIFHDRWDYVLIPDTRYPNEIDVMRRYVDEVQHVRVLRTHYVSDLTEEQQQHESETALDDVEPDLWIHNDDSLEKLKNVIAVLVRAEAI